MPPVLAKSSKLNRISRAAHKLIFPSDFSQEKRRADGPPSALRSYIDYYRKLDAPGFAVLVTGAWGIGKTHQVLHSLDEDEFHLVSLFGMHSAEELRSAVFAQMYPSRARIKMLLKDAQQSMHAVSGLAALGGLTPTLLGAFLDKAVSTERVLVFDDLERCRIPLKILLGVINSYVEHAGCRVIVIVHDTKVVDSYLKDAKEKVFGQTLNALPQTSQAFEEFMKPHRGTAFGDFLAPYEQDVLDIYIRSKRPSLRLLKYLIEDLRRFHEALDDRHRSNKAAMTEVVKMISVFATEIRDNVMTPDDLANRSRQAIEAASKIGSANTRYGTIQLHSNTLQDGLLSDMFVKGIYSADDIRRNLDESVHFLVPKEDPPWRTVINFDKLADEQVAIGLARMNAQIETFAAIETGEMLHILALRLMMAEQGISGLTPAESVAEAKAYIDGMHERCKIPPRPLRYDWKHERYSSHDGIGYWVSRPMEANFKQIVDHLREKQEAALNLKLEAAIPDLLVALGRGEKFFEMLVSTYTGDNPYAHVAILDKIEPETFIKAWLAAPKASWYWIGNTISERYKASFHSDPLKRERPWAREVVRLLRAENSKLDGLARFRLSRAVPVIGGPEDDVEPIVISVARVDGAPLTEPAATPVETSTGEAGSKATRRRRVTRIRPT